MKKSLTITVGVEQRGAGMIVAVILLSGLLLIALAGLRTASTELQMARNYEEEKNAFQTAQAAIDFVSSDTDNLPTVGALNVAVVVALPVGTTLSPTPFTHISGDLLTVESERTIDCGLPLRLKGGSSLRTFSTFSYKISSDINKQASGRGRASLRQGYTVLGPKC
jgi:hypothetical protein